MRIEPYNICKSPEVSLSNYFHLRNWLADRFGRCCGASAGREGRRDDADADSDADADADGGSGTR